MVLLWRPQKKFPSHELFLASQQTVFSWEEATRKMKTHGLGGRGIEVQGMTGIAAHPHPETFLKKWKQEYITSWSAYLSSGGWSSCCLEAWWKQRRKQELACGARPARTFQLRSYIRRGKTLPAPKWATDPLFQLQGFLTLPLLSSVALIRKSIKTRKLKLAGYTFSPTTRKAEVGKSLNSSPACT